MTTPGPAVEAPAVEVPSASELGDASQPTKPEIRGPSEIVPNVLIDDLKESHANRGVLIPLKTTQEVRQDHTITHAFITRAPTKQANEVITFVHPNFEPQHYAVAQEFGC